MGSAKGGAGSSDYHLQHLLNKENKALQNLLAAVELNRTAAVQPQSAISGQQQPSSMEATGKASHVITRATASAKQQMHLMHMQQQ